MKILNGKSLSQAIKDELKEKVCRLEHHHKSICLSIIQVGEDEASSVYVKNKQKACQYVGIRSNIVHLPEDTTEEQLIKIVDAMNCDPSVTGILIQLPLPKHIDEKVVLSRIAVNKDVDGFRDANVGNLILGNDYISACTPAGIIKLLKHYEIEIAGKECVVVGRSNIVGKPTAILLLQHDGTVTICHSKTKNLKDICSRADILICAIGKPKFFTREYFKDGAVVIDVGIHKQENGTLCGDVDFDDVVDVVSAITPVPGGVGAMTVAMLMDNCVKLAYR